jgi:uncharacterized YceG family protein
MSWNAEDEAAARRRTAEEREAARQERERRRAEREGAALPEPEPEPELEPEPEPAPDAEADFERPAAASSFADDESEPGIRRIQPSPPAPPPAPAGTLTDEPKGPRGTRWTRHPPIVTPPGDVPPGPARARRGLPRRTRRVAVLAFLLLVVVGIFLVYQPFAGRGTGSVRVTIPAGASTSKIGHVLADAGVVRSAFFFTVRATLSGARGDLRSGPHLLRHDMGYGAAIDALSTPPPTPVAPPTVKVTIPEGLSRQEIQPLVRRAGVKGDYLSASTRFSGVLNPFRYGAPKGTRSLEGFLFPATYDVATGGDGARELVVRQLQAFKENFATVSLGRAHTKNLTGYDVLTIASMVEREARVARDRPLIAAVIYNRLKQGMPLGIDATIRYATGNWSRPLTESELRIASPYNSRTHTGLPPTPIGNPGLASIAAAAHPAKVGYVYFVVKPGTCGEHVFSSTEAQFERDAARYNAARAQRGGKSPTTC